jgi:hypothetical protein
MPWKIAARRSANDPRTMETARTKLAEFVIGLARKGSGPYAKTMTETASPIDARRSYEIRAGDGAFLCSDICLSWSSTSAVGLGRVKKRL